VTKPIASLIPTRKAAAHITQIASANPKIAKGTKPTLQASSITVR
jgi:hypothetical protein